MATLPRGIQLQEWVKKDGSKGQAFRVRIIKKDFKANQAFDTLEEAQEFLALSKSKKRGREIIYNITQAEKQKKDQARLDKLYAAQKPRYLEHDYSFGYFVQEYIKLNVTLPKNYTELEKRAYNNKMSFFRTILKTSIEDRYITHEEREALNIPEGEPVYKHMRGFDIRKIKNIEINSYVRERLKTIKKISVQREVTFISNVFEALQDIDDSKEIKELENPTRTYQKKLTRGAIEKREFTFNENDESLLFDMLSKIDNKEYYNVAKLSLLTGLRRSECLYLTKDMVDGAKLKIFGKGKKRTVWMMPPAQEFIKTLPVTGEKGRFFRLTIGGFEKMFREYCSKEDEHGNQPYKHLIRFHDLRRTNISRTLTEIGLENSVVLATVLGMSNVGYLEKTWADRIEDKSPTTQKQAMKNYGHSFAQTTKGYYTFNTSNIKFKPKETK